MNCSHNAQVLVYAERVWKCVLCNEVLHPFLSSEDELEDEE